MGQESAMAEGAMHVITVEDVLAIPQIQAGSPEVISGRSFLQNPVRWVHVAEATDIASALRGSELLLTEGQFFDLQPENDRLRFRELSERSTSALVLELGRVIQSVPDHWRTLGDETGIVIVALHQPVAFIDVTEAIHSELFLGKTSLEQSAHRIGDHLTAEVLNGADLESFLGVASRALDHPILFVSERGAISFPPMDTYPRSLTQALWESYVHGEQEADTTLIANVEVSGQFLGRFVAFSDTVGVNEISRLVMDRLRFVGGYLLLRDAHTKLSSDSLGILSALVSGELPPYIASPKAASKGFQPNAMMPILVQQRRWSSGPPATRERQVWRRINTEIARELESRGISALVDETGDAQSAFLVVALQAAEKYEATLERVAKILRTVSESHLKSADAITICVGEVVHTWQALAVELRNCVKTLPLILRLPHKAWHLCRYVDLDRLLLMFHEEPALHAFAAQQLKPLIEFDEERNTRLVETLKTFIESNGNKTETARLLHLERQSLYNRMQRISDLLNVDLEDSRTRLGLHLALYIRSLLYRVDHLATEDVK